MSIVPLEGRTFVLELEDRPGTSLGTRSEHWLVRKRWGARRISMRYLVFGPGRSPAQRNAASDEVWFVMNGRATLYLDGRGYDIEPEAGVYIRPEVWAWVENSGDPPLRIISVICPEEESEISSERVQEDLPRAESVMPPVIRLSDREPQETGDRFYQVLADSDIGTREVTQFVGVIPPGRAPDHHHTYEEVITILQGTGYMWAGKTKTPVSPGSCIYLPAGQTHCLENTSTGPLRLMGVFYPSGSPATNYPD